MTSNPEPHVAREIDTTGDANPLVPLQDAIGDMITSVPAPIRKNAWRAFGRLCTAAVDYPVALLEGLVAEKRAESEARVKLIKTSSAQLAKQLKVDPAFVDAANFKFAQKILRERCNLDQIVSIAHKELAQPNLAPSHESESAAEAQPINDDWLNAFEIEASKMSSDEMQLLFGKILAGEIRHPSSFSRKTIRLISQLDNRAAQLFLTLCSVSISIRLGKDVVDARVISMGNAGENSLREFGLSFDALNTLQEYGLITPELGSDMNFEMCVARNGPADVPITYLNKLWELVPVDPTATSGVRITGVGFSLSGKELLPLVDIEEKESYTAKLREYLFVKGYQLVPQQ